MAVTSTIQFSVDARQTKDVTGAGTSTVEAALPFTFGATNASGVLINTQDQIYAKRRSVATGTPDTIDVAGALFDAFGDSIAMAKVTGLFIKNNSTTAGEILSVGAGSNPLINWVMATGDGIKIGPGGLFVIFNPSLAAYAVTATTGDVLTVAAAAGTVSYDVLILGRTA